MKKICEECGAVWVTKLEDLNVSFRGSRKGNYYNIPEHFMIDKKLQELFQANQITGYELKNICFVGSDQFREDGIQEMVITGRAGHIYSSVLERRKDFVGIGCRGFCIEY